ncbi:MAG: 50S ribosomal protein L35 [Candidatus Sungbacteria bacterium]|nr:50S ribosomal protein L35 [Candidatus Sungbacteria bacterium]
MKPNKSILKRIKITSTGKLIRRKARLNHFNAKASRKVQRRQAQSVAVTGTYEKMFRRYLAA